MFEKLNDNLVQKLHKRPPRITDIGKKKGEYLPQPKPIVKCQQLEDN